MPSINRIRVNNVKYNFGTQYYDDFTMRMHGKNTLYDLANGGGKSVLMLLLLQNMIPNCTLDEKQPIEKMFRTGNGNTTIHSLVEWKLDEADSTEGYRYMTTGFCARKAKEAEGEIEAKKDVASIEYFNYCIFYREFNKNDIINLPLVNDGERITFQGLRTYLKDLEHKDMSLMVRVFDRKGEYQRFISDYGIHESQWEIIRGINKTEGHVRTYFENNYKTTRKVVEDLLIEEIIEKAFLVKTERDEDGSESMAKMLMDIKEQLTVLAKKKKDISGYDHQIELLKVLSDKVESFMDLYQEQSRLTKILADICVTGEEFAKNDEAKMEELARARDEKRDEKNRQRERIECLKVSKDKKQLEEKKELRDSILNSIQEAKARLDGLEKELSLKEAVNEYFVYMEDRKKYQQLDTVIKTMMFESSFDEEMLYTYAYNIKARTDVVLTNIRGQIKEIQDKLLEVKLKKEYNDKLLQEAKIAYAVADNSKKTADEEIVKLSEKLSEVRLSMNNIRFTDLSMQLEDNQAELELIQNKIKDKEEETDNNKNCLNDEQLKLSILYNSKAENDKLIEQISAKENEYKEAWDKLENIKAVYMAKDEASLAGIIRNRINQAVLDKAEIEKAIEKSDKYVERLNEGRIVGPSKAVQKVLDYIETRHGFTAMTGMDYLSALKAEHQKKVLAVNPEIPYGILVKEYENLKDDPNIADIDTGDETVTIFDMDAVEEKALHYGENAFAVHVSGDYLTDAETIQKLVKAEKDRNKDLHMQLEVKEEMLAAYAEDQEFILKIYDSEFITAGDRLIKAREYSEQLSSDISECEEKIRRFKISIEKAKEEIIAYQKDYETCISDINKLHTASKLSELINQQEEISASGKADIERLEEQLRQLETKNDDSSMDAAEEESKLKSLEKRYQEISDEWDNTYKAYYNVEQDYEMLTISDDEIKARFTAMLSAGRDDAKAIDDKKMLMETLMASMDRSIKNIEKYGVNKDKLASMEEAGELFLSDENVISVAKKNILDAKEQLKQYETKLKEQEQIINRLEGSISYAIKNIEDAFGAYVEEDASLSEIISSLEHGEELLARLDREAKECDENYKKYFRQQGYMVDLYKDVKRIIITNEISLEGAKPIPEEKDKLRDIFEENLLKYDKSNKLLEKAKNELLKFKGNTAASLDRMEVYELANTIRGDVVIPEDYEEAKALMENLRTIVEYIALEKDRVEKSLADMETIKANFEEQCLQRCLDVKTELDKLPKLSRIIADGEAIQMVGLTIPYVKDEFLKQKMSDYIDRIVAQADDYEQDKDRIKFIRNSLTLKKLFGVIVTDMNGIKLNLYKRERIKEQSRYLRYEEAVGSTGQSQGIYIQFLVSIINYISGMYQTGNEDIRTKTIFIDNPFGAAKDVYIWEPIFALLKANNVQLIVPARGATPAITGRFDVNYILGQQMSGGKQLTVVSDYTSKVDQEELEYKDLEFEQVSFDFI